MKGVEDIQFNKEWVDRMVSFSRLAKAVGYFLGGILVLASFFIISNIVKLNVLARKNEIEIDLVRAVTERVSVPVIASGGAGTLEQVADVIRAGKPEAVLLASLFHEKSLTVRDVKDYLKGKGVLVRW